MICLYLDNSLMILSGSTSIASAIITTLLSAQGLLMGLGGVCTAFVALHGMVVPHAYLTFKNHSLSRYGGSLRVFASPMVKAPIFLAYAVISVMVLVRSPDAVTLMRGDQSEHAGLLILITPHIVGVILAWYWRRRLPDQVDE